MRSDLLDTALASAPVAVRDLAAKMGTRTALLRDDLLLLAADGALGLHRPEGYRLGLWVVTRAGEGIPEGFEAPRKTVPPLRPSEAGLLAPFLKKKPRGSLAEKQRGILDGLLGAAPRGAKSLAKEVGCSTKTLFTRLAEVGAERQGGGWVRAERNKGVRE